MFKEREDVDPYFYDPDMEAEYMQKQKEYYEALEKYVEEDCYELLRP